MSFVPDDFAVPRSLVGDGFWLEPLGPEHNEGDYQAWTSSIAHIRATPGFEGRSWVSADRAALDVPLYEAVSAWLRSAWPFSDVRYASRR
jgi:hypothetical protein